VTAVWIVVAAVCFGLAWYFHRQLYPKRVCPRCGGSKRIPGGFGTFRDCPRCNKSGEIQRGRPSP